MEICIGAFREFIRKKNYHQSRRSAHMSTQQRNTFAVYYMRMVREQGSLTRHRAGSALLPRISLEFNITTHSRGMHDTEARMSV